MQDHINKLKSFIEARNLIIKDNKGNNNNNNNSINFINNKIIQKVIKIKKNLKIRNFKRIKQILRNKILYNRIQNSMISKKIMFLRAVFYISILIQMKMKINHSQSKFINMNLKNKMKINK